MNIEECQLVARECANQLGLNVQITVCTYIEYKTVRMEFGHGGNNCVVMTDINFETSNNEIRAVTTPDHLRSVIYSRIFWISERMYFGRWVKITAGKQTTQIEWQDEHKDIRCAFIPGYLELEWRTGQHTWKEVIKEVIRMANDYAGNNLNDDNHYEIGQLMMFVRTMNAAESKHLNT